MLGLHERVEPRASPAPPQISPLVDVVDLDGHLLNANDTHTGLGFADGCVLPGDGPGLGVDSAGAVAVKRYVILAEGGVRRGGEDRHRRDALRAVADRRRDRLHPRRHGRRRPRARPRERRARRGARWPTRCRSSRRRSWSASRRRAASCPTRTGAAIIDALENGLDVESGLHDFLGDDPEFATAAHLSGRELRDLRRVAARPERADRREPRRSGAHRADGRLGLRLGKMTVCLELDARGAPPRPGVGLRARPARPGSPSPGGGSRSTR